MESNRKKIVVLGGGISSLTTAFELTDQPGWQDLYEITIYQLGWRLGGKGASSCNPQAHNRIEEHGLHIWLGFYENAFNVIRRCYTELARPSGAPLATWRDAFKPHSFVVLEEHIDNQWIHWPFTFPTNPLVPGDGLTVPTLWEYVVMALRWLRDSFSQHATRGALPNEALDIPHAPPWFDALLSTYVGPFETATLNLGGILLKAAGRHAEALGTDVSNHSAAAHQIIRWLLEMFSDWLCRSLGSLLTSDTDLRRLWIPIDIVAAITRGLLADGVIFHGLDSLDSFEFRQWLRKHNASDIALDSAWLRGAYDLGFSFERGDTTKPSVAAGVAIRSGLRMIFTYTGAILWKMEAGMGETVFAPLYEVLRRRGVTFKFFHRVTNLGLSQDESSIVTISFSRQASLKDAEYNPLVTVNGLSCWPPAPLFGQLVEGDALQQQQINLESFWTPWPGVDQVTLEAGKDFDTVVLGIPVSSLPVICSELLKANQRWRDMTANIRTIQTQGFQIWLKKDLTNCGWKYASPVLGAYTEPLDTWADMSHLLIRESWSSDEAPKQLAYFCGVMKDADMIPPPSDYTFPKRESERTRGAAIEYLEKYIGYLWPAASDHANPASLEWNALVAPNELNGRDRFDAQYWRANIDPSERYVLAVPASTQFRLRTDESGFRNLILTGDWIRNGFNSPGCIESAVISGRQAARAISGRMIVIPGESDFPVG